MNHVNGLRKKFKIQCMASRETSHIFKKNRKNQASSFCFKKLNKVHHGIAYNQRHVRNPHSFTDQEQ